MKQYKNNKFEKIYIKIKKIDILFSFNINEQIILKIMHIRLTHNDL
jgi:hypothetical protein